MAKSIHIFHWLPRIVGILAILFVSMFAADAFAPGLTIWKQLGAFFMHLIPSFILITFLVIAWKWEYVGGMIFIILGLALSPVVFSINYKMNHSMWMSMGIILMITLPFVFVGILFLISHRLKKKNTRILPPPS